MPEVTIRWIGGQRPRIACASFHPSIEPDMLMSVKTARMSASALQNLDRLVGIAGFHDHKPGIFHHLDGTHPDKCFVFDDQNYRFIHICLVSRPRVRTAGTNVN